MGLFILNIFRKGIHSHVLFHVVMPIANRVLKIGKLIILYMYFPWLWGQKTKLIYLPLVCWQEVQFLVRPGKWSLQVVNYSAAICTSLPIIT